MPFNPAVQDKTADYIFEGAQLQAGLDERARLRQQQQLGEAFDAFDKMATSFQKNAQKDALIDGKTAAVLEVAKADPDLVGGMDFVNAIVSEKNRDKRAGMLLMADEMFNMGKQQRVMDAQFGNQLALQGSANTARARLQDDSQEFQAALAAADRTGQTTTVTDPVTGQRIGLYYQNNRQVVPIDTGADAGQGVRRVDLGGGQFAFFDGKGNPVPKSAVMGSEEEADPATATRVSLLQQRIAKIDGQMATDPKNKKAGPDWWPFGQSFEAERAGLQAELDSLTGAQRLPAAPAENVKPQPAQTLPKPATKAEFDALPSGTIYIGRDGRRYKKP